MEKLPVVYYYDLINRGIMFSLVIFILLILFFLSWYPISLSRNLVIHTAVFALFLISASMGYLVKNVNGVEAHHAVNLVHLVITVGCWSAWMFFLTPQGEETKRVVREWSGEEEKRLVDRLTAINASLVRATRK